MKYPVFALLGIGVVGIGCFNPHIKEGGFACSGTQDGQCPTGFFCVNHVCVDNPNAAGNPGVGGNGGTGDAGVDDMAMSVAADMSMPGMSTSDLAPPIVVVDLSMPKGPDLSRPPPDMTKVNTCAHNKCSTGAALDPTCDPCVSTVCNNDPTCCDTVFGQWDSICVGDTRTYCTPSQACP